MLSIFLNSKVSNNMKLPIVLIPGILCNAMMWQAQQQYFGEITKVVILNVTKRKSIRELADEIANLSYPKVNIVGFSSGGYVAQDFAVRYPDRIHKLVLMNTSGEDFAAEQQVFRLSLLKKCDDEGVEVGAKTFYNKLLSSYENGSPVRIKVEAMVNSIDATVFIHQMKAVADYIDYLQPLSLINAPTLVIASSDDPFMNQESYEELEEKVPDAKLVVTPDGGHILPISKPDFINQQLASFFTLPSYQNCPDHRSACNVL